MHACLPVGVRLTSPKRMRTGRQEAQETCICIFPTWMGHGRAAINQISLSCSGIEAQYDQRDAATLMRINCAFRYCSIPSTCRHVCVIVMQPSRILLSTLRDSRFPCNAALKPRHARAYCKPSSIPDYPSLNLRKHSDHVRNHFFFLAVPATAR